MGGVARRTWARNENAIDTSVAWNKKNSTKGHITIPFLPDEQLVDDLMKDFD